MVAATRRRVVVAAIASVMICARVHAHDVVVEQIVRMMVAPQSGRLDVRLQVPLSLLADAGLRPDDGRVDPARGDRALQAVAADVARNLDFRLRETALNVTRMTARPGSDGQSVDVEITYGLSGPANGLSARLNAFPGTPLQPPRTDLAYQPASGQPQLLTLTGPPARVAFDPSIGEVMREFIGRAFTTVLAGGDHLLFLICLLVPMRTARQSLRLVATVLAAQALGIATSSMLPTTSALAVEMIAWSAVAAASLCGIVGSSVQTFALLAGVFGLLSGVELGGLFTGIRQLAGAHVRWAVLTFTIVTLLAESWIAAVMWATRSWLDSFVGADRIVTVLALALVAHVALHRVFDRGREIAQTGAFGAEHAVTMLVLGWTLVMVGVALRRFTRGARPHSDREMLGRATG
jgi:hypothetical protein